MYSPSLFISLKILILRNNRLDDLKALHLHPSVLPHLEELDIAHNLFVGLLPDCLPPTLLRLDISHNQFDSLAGLTGCPNLTTLIAHGNSLQVLTGLPPKLEVRWVVAG